MKIMKKPIKNVKKVIYQGRIQKFRRFIALMVIGGILASAGYFVMTAYSDYASSTAHVVLTYPEIAESQYPDGSRFTYYDFVNLERLEEALDVMQSNGKYESYTVDDIKDSFYVRSYLDASASNDVALARLDGNDFSYVANEYKISFTQPHDYGNDNILKKIVSPNYSDEFLKVLVDINKKYIAETKSGKAGFDIITELGDMYGYDYDEKTEVYKTKINAIVSYLKTLESTAPNFISEEYKMSLKDVAGKYELLLANKLDGIADFIESSGISRNTEVAVNKLNVNLENSTLKYNKYRSEAEITRYAMQNYDQTFTENLINVVRDEAQGLYQARPKTAFDKVVTKNNTAEEFVSEYRESINNLNQELVIFKGSVIDVVDEAAEAEAAAAEGAEQAAPAENAAPAPAQGISHEDKNRLAEKCDTLFADLDKEYGELTKIACYVVDDCLNITNEKYMTADITRDNIFNASLATKLLAMFFAGAVLMFVLCMVFSILADSAELRRKNKLLKKISEEKGA
ncbi:MAG: LapA family protein [Clostridia bacterium]|nr:LapA family protein [Clostridia bacterium]